MSEFSRIMETHDIPDQGMRREVSATPAERRAIAARLGLEDLAEFEGVLDVVHASRGAVKVSGMLAAEFTQICVVSLDEFSSRAELPVERTFVPDRGAAQAANEVVVDPLLDDEPDPIVDGTIDLGELLVETLALALDPYPRKAGAEFVAPVDDAADADGGEKDHPFSVLAKLAPRQ